MAFPPFFDHAWDLTQPPDTQAANLLGLDIRNLKDDVMQRLSILSGTVANRPNLENTNGALWGGVGFGVLFFATDTSQVFQWNGNAWLDVTVSFVKSQLLNAQANLAAIVGTGANVIMFSYVLPTNTVALLKGIRVTVSYNHSTGAANVTYVTSLNGTIVSNNGSAAAGVSVQKFTILNTGAASGTFTGFSQGAIGGIGASGLLAGLAWANNQVLQITFNTPNTDQVTPLQWLVELVQ